jgi:hypothetical protein
MKTPQKSTPENDDAVHLAHRLQDLLGMKTKISTSTTGGSITFYFNSFEQLDDFIQKLDG